MYHYRQFKTFADKASLCTSQRYLQRLRDYAAASDNPLLNRVAELTYDPINDQDKCRMPKQIGFDRPANAKQWRNMMMAINAVIREFDGDGSYTDVGRPPAPSAKQLGLDADMPLELKNQIIATVVRYAEADFI